MTQSTRRRVVGTLAVLATLAALAGCTPADKPVAALRLVDGRPTLLVVPCDEARIDWISVFTTGGTTPPPGESGIVADWAANSPNGEAPEQVRLLEAPAGWTVTKNSLTEFTPGTEYTATALGSPGDAFSIDFTLAALEVLGPDEVLVGEHPDAKVMSEKDFRENADDACRGSWLSR